MILAILLESVFLVTFYFLFVLEEQFRSASSSRFCGTALDEKYFSNFLCKNVQVFCVKISLYLRKAGLASRNIVHIKKNHSTLWWLLLLFSTFSKVIINIPFSCFVTCMRSFHLMCVYSSYAHS